jgi:hypothetical protein
VGAYEYLALPYRWVEEEPTENNWKVYPNPLTANQMLTIVLNQALQAESQAFLIDMTGKTILKQSFERGRKTFQLNLQSMPLGTYLLQIAGVGMKKVVINK